MLSFAQGSAVNLDIYIYVSEGGALTDPDGYAGGTEPTLKIYDQSGTEVHSESDNTNITRLSEGHYQFTGYTLAVDATLGSNWRVVWYFEVNGTLLAATTRTEYFEVVSGGAAAYSNPYDSKSEVVELVEGVAVADINETWRDWAKTVIDLECGHDFYSHDAGTEVHDIERDDQDTIILRHWPPLAVTRLRDTINGVTSSTPTTISSDHYYLYDDGRLKLVSDTYTVFTEGPVNVDVQYTYGYATIPSEVRMLANLLVAFRAQVYLLETEASSTGAFGMRQIRMGDYEATFGQNLNMVEDKFGSEVTGGIKRMMELVKHKYGYIGYGVV